VFLLQLHEKRCKLGLTQPRDRLPERRVLSLDVLRCRFIFLALYRDRDSLKEADAGLSPRFAGCDGGSVVRLPAGLAGESLLLGCLAGFEQTRHGLIAGRALERENVEWSETRQCSS
jgi:hypothetical protein